MAAMQARRGAPAVSRACQASRAPMASSLRRCGVAVRAQGAASPAGSSSSGGGADGSGAGPSGRTQQQTVVVRNISARDAANMMAQGWVLLDVRPQNEVRKARLKGAVEVPVFLPDTSVDLGSLLKQMSAFGMGGWWLGGTHMVANPGFIAEVQARVPGDARLVVTCQKGLRSLAACEQLSAAGYTQLAWMNGGLDSCKEGELSTVSGVDVRYGGVGGLSGALGWTEVQQQESKSMLGGLEGVFKIAGAIILLDGLLFAYEASNNLPMRVL